MKRLSLEKIAFGLGLTLIVYMPLHVFVVQSASLLTGGVEVWKAAKDILLVAAMPLLLYMAYRQQLHTQRLFHWLSLLVGVYALLHLLYVALDTNDDTVSAIIATVYNLRLFGYLLLGWVIGAAHGSKRSIRYLLTAAVIIASLVAAFGIAQYFLPPDLLSHVGYSESRGVKALFFIDDRPDLPRVMSTLKDPNSLGAYLILPILLTGWAALREQVNKSFFIRPFRKMVLFGMLSVQLTALILTFSRGALLGLLLSVGTLLLLTNRERFGTVLQRYWLLVVGGMLLISGVIIMSRDSQFVQDYVLHAAISTNEADPNEKRILLQTEAIEDIIEEPEGHGPGSAGLVSIRNPQGGVLTENYYLQIGYEVGWLGLIVFIVSIWLIARTLWKQSAASELAAVLLASLVAYLFYSLLIHLWSNEAVALQWWLLAGLSAGGNLLAKKTTKQQV